MLTITNNQQTPSFKERVKVGKASTKLGQYMKNKKINPNGALLISAGAAGAAGSVAMFSPDVISAPDAAKWALGGGMASTLGLMGFSHLKPKLAKAETETIPEAETEFAVEENTEVADASKNVEEEVVLQPNDKDLFTVEGTPLGEIKLSKKDKDFYMCCANMYANGIAKIEYYGSGNTESGVQWVTEATLKMEILKSLHELSTRFNNVISSKTFGKIKVTEKGIKDYIKAVKKYSAGIAKIKYYGSGNTEAGVQRVNEAKAEIELIKAFGQL